MLTILIQTMQQIFNLLIHEWDTLVKKVGKSTANVLLTYIALVVLFEVIWLTLVISILVLVIVLN